MHFTKYQGLGNDFIFVQPQKETFSNLSRAAQKLCDRRFGIGADGLILMTPQTDGCAQMQIINADGSQAEMCGNASRCAPLFWREKGHLKGNQLVLQTLAGPILTQVQDWAKGQVSVDMGVPRLIQGEKGLIAEAQSQAVDIPLTACAKEWRGTAVSMGNPHFVIFVDDVSAVALEKVGPEIEKHSLFPYKTNVEFVQVLDEHTLRMRVWERGAGITQACGTGSCAAAVAGVLSGRSAEKVRILLDGGELAVDWTGRGHIQMTGPAQKVFEGEYHYAL